MRNLLQEIGWHTKISIGTKMEEPNTLFTIGEIIKIPEARESKFQYEFQELGVELEPYYGKLIWTIFWRLGNKKGFTPYQIRKAHEICQKKGNLTFPYLVGVLKRLP